VHGDVLPWLVVLHGIGVGLAKTIYKRFIHGIFGREITRHAVICGVYIRFWPSLNRCNPALYI